MLSYRHGFHAGNHADVLKHLTEVLTLQYLVQKDKPLCYIDTHAGAGSYALNDSFARHNSEFESGIGRLWQADKLPASVESYLALVQQFNGGELKPGALHQPDRYPGSPAIARALLRPQDRMRLFELHPADMQSLQRWQRAGAAGSGVTRRRLQLEQEDGFAGLLASLPPLEKRVLAVIDPPYEVKQDYVRVVKTIKTALERFATGTYLIWYPLLARQGVERGDPVQMATRLRALCPRYLQAELWVRNSDSDGMYGSGVFVVNPPWHLQAQLTEALPFLQQCLATDSGAGSRLLSAGLL